MRYLTEELRLYVIPVWFTIDCHVDFMGLSSYAGTKSTGVARTILDLKESIEQCLKRIYDEIKNSYPELCTIYLSSSILPKRRKQIIKLIIRNITNGKRMILVSTQVVEAGVDIDFDIVFRDYNTFNG